MIRYNPHAWWTLIFKNYSKGVSRQLLPSMIMQSVYTTAVVMAMLHYFEFEYQGATTIHSLLGIVLGLFLVFRTNTSYDRWWEGRKLWGKQVNVSRNLAVKINTIFPDSLNDDRIYFARMISNFNYAFKESLREGVIMSEMQNIDDPTFLSELEKRKHKPLYIVDHMYQRLNERFREGHFSGEQFLAIDLELQEFMDIIGACERIRNTPIPYSYNMFIKKFIFIYCSTLPLGLLSLTHYWTIPISIGIFYILVSTELIAEEIEDPFGRDDNDLPVDELCAKIKLNTEEVLFHKPALSEDPSEFYTIRS
jgi:putative membrane protein